MNSKKNIFVILFLLVVFLPKSYSQVTIGSDSNPPSGALLQIKDVNTASSPGDITATKGAFLLPRMSFNAIPSSSSDEYIGMMVYNISTNASFKPGIYVWEGTKWQLVVSTEKPEEIEQ